jgi:hypothetical protein
MVVAVVYRKTHQTRLLTQLTSITQHAGRYYHHQDCSGGPKDAPTAVHTPSCCSRHNVPQPWQEHHQPSLPSSRSTSTSIFLPCPNIRQPSCWTDPPTCPPPLLARTMSTRNGKTTLPGRGRRSQRFPSSSPFHTSSTPLDQETSSEVISSVKLFDDPSRPRWNHHHHRQPDELDLSVRLRPVTTPSTG